MLAPGGYGKQCRRSSLEHSISGHHGGYVVMGEVYRTPPLPACRRRRYTTVTTVIRPLRYFGAVSVSSICILSGAHSCETYWLLGLDLLRPFLVCYDHGTPPSCGPCQPINLPSQRLLHVFASSAHVDYNTPWISTPSLSLLPDGPWQAFL